MWWLKPTQCCDHQLRFMCSAASEKRGSVSALWNYVSAAGDDDWRQFYNTIGIDSVQTECDHRLVYTCFLCADPPLFFSLYPSQQLFSCLSWKAEPSCFSPFLASQAGTCRLTNIHKHTPFSVSALSHTHLALDCVLTTFWTAHWGASIPTCLLGCFDCMFTLLWKNCLTVQRLTLMVSCLTGSWVFLTSCCSPFSLWHFLRFSIFHGGQAFTQPLYYWQSQCVCARECQSMSQTKWGDYVYIWWRSGLF